MVSTTTVLHYLWVWGFTILGQECGLSTILLLLLCVVSIIVVVGRLVCVFFNTTAFFHSVDIKDNNVDGIRYQ